MESKDIFKFIKQSFGERNILSMFLIAIGVSVLFIFLCAGVLFYFRGEIFGYFAKGYLSLSPDVEENSKADITEKIIEKESIFTQEYFVVDAVKKTNPAVVAIVISKEVPKYEVYINPNQKKNPLEELFPGFNFGAVPEYRQNGTEEKEIGGGSGFFVSNDGLIVTNKHVVNDATAIYTVYTNDGKRHAAEVVDRDPIFDIAFLKINSFAYSHLPLGNSDSLFLGQSVIAIGNALGEFKNTVSVGVISGLSRSVSAGDSTGQVELLDHVIQTDASINPGNSGGPLLDLSGRVIGVNVAVVQGSQGIGFALPVNSVKGAIESVKTTGKIVRPYLGVRYVQINSKIKEANNLPVDYGVLIKAGSGAGNPAVMPGSPALRAGIKEGDIILSIDGVKITEETSLSSLVGQKKIGQTVDLRILRNGAEQTIQVILEAFKGIQ